LSLAIFASPIIAQTAISVAQTIDPDSLDNERRRPDLSLAYKTVGGLDLPMAVFLPANRTSLAERRPAIVGIHGGAWSGWRGGDCATWDGGIFAPHARYFSARGAVAVTISYRNVFAPGKDKAAFGSGPGLVDLLADCRAAVRYLRKNADRFGIDPDHIAVVGDSAGGHLAACLGTIDHFDDPGEDLATSALANLVVACNPITDLTDPAWLPYVHETPRNWDKGQTLSLDDRAKAISPLWNVSDKSAPTLVIHGIKDTIVQPRHSSDFQQALQKAGVRSELSTLPEATHAFVLLGYRSIGSDWLAVMNTIDRFLVDNGYLIGGPVVTGPSSRGLLTSIAGDRLADGRIPGTNGLALTVPDSQKPGVTTVEIVADPDRGQVLKLGKGSEGLALTGQNSLGSANSVSLWINPAKAGGTLVRRSVWASSATGYKLALNNKGALTLQVAGATLTADVAPLNQWSHVIASIAPDRASLYLNGKLVAEQPLHGAVLIGLHFVIGEGYTGLLSDIQLSDRPANPDSGAIE
jgi:acetyl esterase/lipase